MSPWTDETVADLHKHFKAGLSCSQSAEAMGMSRAQVIGKRQRLGLTDSGRKMEKPVSPEPRKRAPRPVTPIPGLDFAPLRLARPAPVYGPLEFRDRHRTQCAWPLGGFSDAADERMMICGCRIVDGHSYCGPHVARSRGKPEPYVRTVPA